MPANPRHLLALATIGLASMLAPASASAHSPRHAARATAHALESTLPTAGRVAVPDRRDRPAPKPARKPASQLPITPVLLGLLALGLTLAALSYARARRAADKARAPTPLRVTPIRAPHTWPPPLGPAAAEHEKRQS